MPYSSDSGKAVIERFIRRKLRWACKKGPAARGVLDLGVGAGAYSTKYKKLIGGEWVGVEIWEPYVEQFKLREKYDHLMLDDVEYALAKLTDKGDRFDFVFIGDILEHMDREKALRVCGLAYKLLEPSGLMFCSVPIGEYPQGEYLGNPHEAHVDTWKTKDELTQIPGVRYMDQEKEIGVAVSCDEESWNKLMEPKIAVYMICKNEENFIRRAVESALEADELVVCDTGSTDKTVDTLQQLAWANLQVKVHEVFISPWRFDDARNVSLSLVSQEVDFCVSLDADELLAPGFIPLLREFLRKNHPHQVTRVNHSFETHWNWFNVKAEPVLSRHYHERIHSRHGYRWVHPVHEKLVNPDERVMWCTDLLIRQLPDTTKNRGTYLPLLEQAVKEDPKDWKLWSFLYQEKLGAGDLEGAKAALEECLKIHDSDKAFLYIRQGELLEKIGDQIGARSAFSRAVEANPQLREVHVAAAEYNWRQRQWKAAYSCYISAKECKNETHGYMRREDCWDDRLEQQVNRLAKELEENVYLT